MILENLSVLDRFMARHADRFSWRRPQAGPIAFPLLRGEAEAEEFCRGLATRCGVLLLPGGVYGAAYSHHLRFGFGR
jgi:aspartate/methionine/tyrosine aminotransferase